MSGLRVMITSTKKGLVLEIPTKDRGILKYFTPISGVLKLIKGDIPVIYFNPRSDFDVRGKTTN